MKTIGHMNIQGEVSGSFKQYDDFPLDPKVGTWAFIGKTLMLCIEVSESPAWIPLTEERNTLIFKQPTPSATWMIEHNFGSNNVLIQCFDVNNKVVQPSSITDIDENVSEVIFPEAIIGKAIVMYGMEHGVSARGSLSGNNGDSIPIGAIMAFAKTPPVSSGYLPCNKFPFSKIEYPDLFELLQAEETPDFTDRYLKMVGNDLSPLQTVAWQLPDHSHEMDISHGHDASFLGNRLPNHGHTSTRSFSPYAGPAAPSNNTDKSSLVNGYKAGSPLQRQLQYNVSGGINSASAGTPSGSVDVNPLSATNRITSGMRESFKIGESVEVDHVGVVYCIKATNGVNPKGLLEVGQIKEDIDSLNTEVADVKAKLNNPVRAIAYCNFGLLEGIPSGQPVATSGKKKIPLEMIRSSENFSLNEDLGLVIPVDGLYKIRSSVLMQHSGGTSYVYPLDPFLGTGIPAAYMVSGLQRDASAEVIINLNAGTVINPTINFSSDSSVTLWSGSTHSSYSVEYLGEKI